MLHRSLSATLEQALDEHPAVVLLGPRQVGKTTLALEVGRARDALYLDLESEQHRALLSDAEAFLNRHQGRLVILDEVHRSTGLFALLRGRIDAARRSGHGTGQYLLLGSASLDLLRQAGESLAGRVCYLELHPVDVLEAGPAVAVDTLWLRGGFPSSLLARDEGRSLRWRRDFLRAYLERDIPMFGRRVPAETMRRFWTMLAHHQATALNAAELARNLGVDAKTVASYLDLLVDLLVVRRLQPWHANVAKRLVKSPKVLIRDSGLVHALLQIGSLDALFGHPVVGRSWEAFVIENVIGRLREQAQPFYYRTSGGSEIDLLLAWPDGSSWAIEVKRSSAPKIERGFHEACLDLQPARKFVVYPGTERFPMAADIEALPLPEMLREIERRTGSTP